MTTEVRQSLDTNGEEEGELETTVCMTVDMSEIYPDSNPIVVEGPASGSAKQARREAAATMLNELLASVRKWGKPHPKCAGCGRHVCKFEQCLAGEGGGVVILTAMADANLDRNPGVAAETDSNGECGKRGEESYECQGCENTIGSALPGHMIMAGRGGVVDKPLASELVPFVSSQLEVTDEQSGSNGGRGPATTNTDEGHTSRPRWNTSRRLGDAGRDS
jgi:hypothetical protein